ncbi:WD40 repeat-like protein, partial [Rhizopogon vinicolor AM-OR11-026]
GSYDGTVILWDTKTWQKKGDPLKCGAHVTWVRFSPTGQLGVATSEDIQIWDLYRRERLAQFKGHTNFNNSWNVSLTWTRDGSHLLSAGNGNDSVLRSWDTSTLKQVGNPWTGHDSTINNIMLNPAGTLLASASNDHTVRLWQLSTGTEVARYEQSDASRVAFSVDGHFIFSGSFDGKMSQWAIPEDVLAAARCDHMAVELNAEAGPSRVKKNPKSHLDREIPGQRHNIAERRVDSSRPVVTRSGFSTDAEHLTSNRLSGMKNFFIRMRPSSDKAKQTGHRPKREASEVVDVPLGQATYDGKQLAGTHKDPVKTFEGHEEYITSISTFPDGKRIATASYDKTIRIWRLEDGREMKKWVVKKIVGALLILRDGKNWQVVSAEGDDPHDDFDKTMYWQLWVRDAETGRVVAGPLDGHTNIVLALDISSDGGIMASGSYDGTVILWDTKTWQKKGDPLKCGAHVFCVRFSPTGQLGVATSEDIQIWDLYGRERLAQFKGHTNFNNSWNRSLTWTRDGFHLISSGVGNDSVLRSWDTSTLKQIGNPWTGHGSAISNIMLNPAGTLLASASYDKTVRLWQLPTGTEVARYEHSEMVFRVRFSVDGRFILSGGPDGKISQWEIPEDVLAVARGYPMAVELNTEAGPSRVKKNPKSHLDTLPEGDSGPAPQYCGKAH